AGDHWKSAVRVSLLVVSVLAVLDVVLVTAYHAVGAAVALVIFQVVNVAVFRRFNARTTGLVLPMPSIRVVAAALVGGAVSWVLRGAPLMLSLPAGVAAFAAVAFMIGAVGRDDLDLVRRARRAPAP